MTTDENIFYGFAFDGKSYPEEQVEQAAAAVRQRLSSDELRRVNDALLARLDEAKAGYGRLSKKVLMTDPAIRRLVNTLVLVNQAWICDVIARNIRSRPHLGRSTVEELYSTAVTGDGYVGGAINAILLYRHRDFGVAAFSHYLARAVTNALLPTSKEEKTFRAVEARTGPLGTPEHADAAARTWVDRGTRPPEAGVMGRELLEVVRRVISLLPTQQQRATATWLIDRILTTGELPTAAEAAQVQGSRVTRERGRQILAATVNNIRRLIEEDYPQLAEQGVNGWEDFKRALEQPRQVGPKGRARSERG